MADELTLQQKEILQMYVQKYMLKFAIPSGVILTIASGIVGFVISGLVAVKANTDFMTEVRDARNEVKEMRTDVEKSRDATAEAKILSTHAAADAQDAAKRLSSVNDQINGILANDYDAFVTKLFANDKFIASVGNFPKTEAEALNRKIDDLKSNLKSSPGTSSQTVTDNVQSNEVNTRSACRDGYVVGIAVKPFGAANSRSTTEGATKSVEVICKPLNVGN